MRLPNPNLVPSNEYEPTDRVTLRDLFAAAALQGLLADSKRDDKRNTPSVFANDAYVYADALLKERSVDRPKAGRDR